jgi:hypothetical protein
MPKVLLCSVNQPLFTLTNCKQLVKYQYRLRLCANEPVGADAIQ